MANDLNRCEFIGRLGKDPSMRYSADGNPNCSFSLAVGWKTKDKDGTEWIPVSVYGKLAEICGEYLSSGKQVYVSGRWNTQKWTDKETGQDRYQTRLIADQMQMLGSKDEAPKRETRQRDGEQVARKTYKPVDDDDSSIPF